MRDGCDVNNQLLKLTQAFKVKHGVKRQTATL